MDHNQNTRMEIIKQLELSRPDRHSFDTLQLARYIETGSLLDVDPDDDENDDAAAAAFAAEVHSTEQLWCASCSKYHPVPSADEMQTSVREFFKLLMDPAKED